MKTKFSSCLTQFGISLFIGIVIVAVAGGAVYPPLLKISAPVVCQGRFEIESQTYSYKPGQVGVQRQVFCVDDQRGTRKEITLLAIFVAGLLYSVGFFIIILVVNAFLPRNKWTAARPAPWLPPSPRQPANPAGNGEDLSQTLRKLKELQEQGLITEEEYQKKKAEILARM